MSALLRQIRRLIAALTVLRWVSSANSSPMKRLVHDGKKAKQESQEDQSERFGKLVQDMVDAGELNPAEAQDRFEQMMQKLAPLDVEVRN